MKWKRWKLGIAVSVVLSLAVGGAGVVEGASWRTFVAVFCAALVTHLGAFLKDHPVDCVEFDEQTVAKGETGATKP